MPRMGTTEEKASLPRSLADSVLHTLRRIIRSIDLQSRYLVKTVGLTGPQLIALREIGGSPEVSLGEVARAISLSQATVTGIVERLEKRGLVDRRGSESDRRKVLMHITAAGEQLLKTAPPLMTESFMERFNSLEDWEKAMILSSLQRIVAMIDVKTITGAQAVLDKNSETPAEPLELPQI
jgi:DNA-binding MarR family transcriptional regulator